MIDTNGPMTVRAVTDPRTWKVVGVDQRFIPHFGYGLVTALVVHCLYQASVEHPKPT